MSEKKDNVFPAMLKIFKDNLAKENTYIDNEKLVVKYASLVVRLEKINKQGIIISDLGKKFNVNFITNGKLAIFYETKIYPICLVLIEDNCLSNLGLEKDIDYTYILDTNHKWEAEKCIIQEMTLELFTYKELAWLGASNNGKEIKVWLK